MGVEKLGTKDRKRELEMKFGGTDTCIVLSKRETRNKYGKGRDPRRSEEGSVGLGLVRGPVTGVLRS